MKVKHLSEVELGARVVKQQRGRTWRVFWATLLLFWIIGVFWLNAVVTTAPLEQAISLDPPGMVDRPIWIPLRERYVLELAFSRSGHSLDQLKRLIGDTGSRSPDGISVPVYWSLTSIGEHVVVGQGSVTAKGAFGWGSDVYRLVDTLRVAPGKYQFHAAILRAVPELSTVPARLVLTYNFKTTDTWQSAALTACVAATAWIVMPFTVLLVLWWGVRAARHYYRAKQG